jgi:hypothetical protein
MDIIDQVLEMFYEDDNIKEKLIKPVKKKAYPYLLGGVVFNLIILLLLILIIFRINNIHNKFTNLMID